ncbi:MAG: hypothetical protein JWO32_2710 [Bacteroidetes bacterium]|nr:hypothetical protein [Bacteroidota bacterium]
MQRYSRSSKEKTGLWQSGLLIAEFFANRIFLLEIAMGSIIPNCSLKGWFESENKLCTIFVLAIKEAEKNGFLNVLLKSDL